MWIRSQGRTGLVMVSCIDAVGNTVMCRGWMLGRYKSHERAVEVLDEIQDQLEDEFGSRVFEMPEE